jgi:type VI secretion system protein ImpB
MSMNAGSVAPKERVNITYRPAAEGAQEEVELPFKILVLGDLTGRPDERPLDEREPIAVDKDSFDKVMAAQALAVDISVPNALTGEPAGAELAVSLRFNGLADFRPDNIAAQVPELRRLLDLRAALVALKGPVVNVPGFVRKIRDLMKDPEQRARLLRELEIEEPSSTTDNK